MAPEGSALGLQVPGQAIERCLPGIQVALEAEAGADAGVLTGGLRRGQLVEISGDAGVRGQQGRDLAREGRGGARALHAGAEVLEGRRELAVELRHAGQASVTRLHLALECADYGAEAVVVAGHRVVSGPLLDGVVD